MALILKVGSGFVRSFNIMKVDSSNCAFHGLIPRGHVHAYFTSLPDFVGEVK
jgi:hypothetical protein